VADYTSNEDCQDYSTMKICHVSIDNVFEPRIRTQDNAILLRNRHS
jgi:hypothetical protein